MDDIISKAKGCEYVDWLLCVCCVDLEWGEDGSVVTWSRRWIDGWMNWNDNAWMISYPRTRGVSMLIDCSVCVVWIWTGGLVTMGWLGRVGWWMDEMKWQCMDDIISKAKGCEYVSWLLCVDCVVWIWTGAWLVATGCLRQGGGWMDEMINHGWYHIQGQGVWLC